jgi:hypothetical protein
MILRTRPNAVEDGGVNGVSMFVHRGWLMSEKIDYFLTKRKKIYSEKSPQRRSGGGLGEF